MVFEKYCNDIAMDSCGTQQMPGFIIGTGQLDASTLRLEVL